MYNFGEIKNIFNNILIESIVTKNEEGRELFKKYLKTIKESNILRTQFYVFNNIEEKVEPNQTTASIFVTENLKLLEKYKIADIVKENKKLIDLLGDKKVEKDYKLAELHESLAKLISTKKTGSNISVITEEIKKVTDFISENKPKQVSESIDLPVSMLTNLMVDKYNEKYKSMNENDREAFKVLMGNDFSVKEEYYSKVVDECNELIDKLIESDDESKDKLLQVKSKLTTENINETNIVSELSKLIELRNNLKN